MIILPKTPQAEQTRKKIARDACALNLFHHGFLAKMEQFLTCPE